MARERPAEVVIVSLGSTAGLRRADEELAGSLERAGAAVSLARAQAPRQLRTMMLTDLAWARAARVAAVNALARHAGSRAPALIYSTTTAALLWPRPGAVRFDALSAANRPGRHGLWQRPLERRRLRQAPALLPWSEGALEGAPSPCGPAGGALVLPVAVEPSAAPSARERDIAAITCAANPVKKGLDVVLAAWRRLSAEQRSSGDELLVAGASSEELARAGIRTQDDERVRVLGRLEAGEYRALLRRARVFVCAPRREDYGLAQLEALADGCQLVSTAAPGPYAALPIARDLDPRLIGEDLAGALACALMDPLPDYRERALLALAPYSREAIDRLVAQQLLARLLA